MNTTNCEHVLDRLPDLAAGRLGDEPAASLRTHLAGCGACAEAWSVVSLLSEAGPRPVPAGLESRLRAAVRDDRAARSAPAAPPVAPVRPRWRVPAWGLAAAAGLVLAVATPVLVDRMGTSPTGVADDLEVAEAVTESLPSPWLDDEAIVAGAPILDGLSDEALEQLLEEMGG